VADRQKVNREDKPEPADKRLTFPRMSSRRGNSFNCGSGDPFSIHSDILCTFWCFRCEWTIGAQRVFKNVCDYRAISDPAIVLILDLERRQSALFPRAEKSSTRRTIAEVAYNALNTSSRISLKMVIGVRKAFARLDPRLNCFFIFASPKVFAVENVQPS
jgi:hypothetical protein